MKHVNILRWTARIIGTLLVIFTLMEFIPAFIKGGGQINVDHPGHYYMVFCFGLAQVGLLLAWQWEGTGGFLAMFGVIASILLMRFWIQGPKMTQSIIAFLFWLIPSFLFIYCWWRTRDLSDKLES